MKTGRQQIEEIVHVCRPTRGADDGTGSETKRGGFSRDGTADWSTLALMSCSLVVVEVEVEAFQSRSSLVESEMGTTIIIILFKQFQACNPIGGSLIWHHFS